MAVNKPIKLSVVMLSVIMLNVVILGVVILNIEAPEILKTIRKLCAISILAKEPYCDSGQVILS